MPTKNERIAELERRVKNLEAQYPVTVYVPQYLPRPQYVPATPWNPVLPCWPNYPTYWMNGTP